MNHSQLYKATFIHKYEPTEIVKLLKRFINLNNETVKYEEIMKKDEENQDAIKMYRYWEPMMNKIFAEIVNIQEELQMAGILEDTEEIITEYGTVRKTPNQLKRLLEREEETYVIVQQAQRKQLREKLRTEIKL